MDDLTTTIGPLMKAARKFKKFNQSDVASAIGCSQSALSKMEHNLLIPNAPQWFLFARFTAIPPENIETGFIDRHSPVRLNDENVSLGFKLPKRYRLNRAQKIREVYPFFHYLEKKIGADAYNEFTQNLGIESEFFVDFDNIISFQLIIDVINLYVGFGKKSFEDISSLVRFGQNDVYWDEFGKAWKQLSTPKDVLEAFAREQKFFQADFTLSVTATGKDLVVSYQAEKHLYHFLKDSTPEAKSFLVNYRKASLENLISVTLGLSIEAIPEAQSTSGLESRFHIYS